MKRRNFFKNGAVATLGAGMILPGAACNQIADNSTKNKTNKKAKNIIFLVSDGMSIGTLNMAHYLSQRKLGNDTKWVDLIKKGTVRRSMMDTASSDSLVTDSAAGGSAWGGGVRIPNGKLNESATGEQYTPILQKYTTEGKSTGCVTSVPITHATPASFCVSYKTRKDQAKIAELYLQQNFDVLMGGGKKYFSAEKREDGKDMFKAFANKGYAVAQSSSELNKHKGTDKPVLGVFSENALPYALDRANDKELENNTPTLRTMTEFAIEKLKSNKNGFVLQVEGGKVDWAAHANDVGGLLYDQIAFDEAVKAAMDFAEKDKETLVIITTDHGNGNPGLFYGEKANENFDRIQKFKYTNDWVLTGLKANPTAAQLTERLEFAQGYAITNEEAQSLVDAYKGLSEEDLYNPYKLPFEDLALIQRKYTSVHFADLHHSSDFVEVAAYGPGSELLNPFVMNTELHNLMLNATGSEKLITHSKKQKQMA